MTTREASIEGTRYTQVEDIPDALKDATAHVASLSEGTATPASSRILIERLAGHLKQAFDALNTISHMTSEYDSDPKGEA